MEPARTDSDTLLLRVFREQRPRMWGFLRRRVDEETAAAELLNETLLDAWDSRADLGAALLRGDRDAARRFVWRSLRNHITDALRAQTRRRKGTESLRAVGAAGEKQPELSAGPTHTECLAAVREVLESVGNRRLRQCLRRWFDGSDLADLARDTGLPVGELRELIRQGRREVLLRSSHRLQNPTGTGPPGGRE